jgi:hypothetical protein
MSHITTQLNNKLKNVAYESLADIQSSELKFKKALNKLFIKVTCSVSKGCKNVLCFTRRGEQISTTLTTT